MSEITLKSNTVSAEVATGVAQLLSPVVRNLIALAVNAKQAHWHLRGMNFIALHEFLDQLNSNANAAADEAAERIVALGLPVDARITSVAEKASNPIMVDGFQQAETMVQAMLAQLDATIAVTREAISELDEIDLASQDVMIATLQQLEKDRWFLQAHLGA